MRIQQQLLTKPTKRKTKSTEYKFVKNFWQRKKGLWKRNSANHKLDRSIKKNKKKTKTFRSFCFKHKRLFLVLTNSYTKQEYPTPPQGSKRPRRIFVRQQQIFVQGNRGRIYVVKTKVFKNQELQKGKSSMAYY